MKNLKIHLVRHAESCSNVLTNEMVDRYNDAIDIKRFKSLVSQYMKKEITEYNNKCIKANINDIEKKLYHIIFSELNIVNKTKEEIEKIIKTINEKCKTKKDWLEFIKNDRMYSKKVKKTIYILKRMNKATYLFEANLSYVGMNQAINLGRNFINKNDMNYDIIITSAKVRTIMTALLSLRSYNMIKPVKIIVVPYMNEISSEAKIVNNDKMNTGVTSKVLKKQIDIIKQWLKNNWIEYYDDIEVIDDMVELNENTMNPYFEEIKTILDCRNGMRQILTKQDISSQRKLVKCNIVDLIKKILSNDYYKTNNSEFVIKYTKIIANIDIFINSCEVDFSFLELYERQFKQGSELNNPVVSNMVYFYTNVLEKLCQYCLKNKELNGVQNIKILLYLHGRLIQDIYDMHYYNFMHQQKKKLGDEFYKSFGANTIVYEQDIAFDDNFKDLQLNDIKILQRPSFVRDKKQNISEFNNNNVCDLESIRGKINLEDDCFENRENQYYKKYMKYKMKYLELRKQF